MTPFMLRVGEVLDLTGDVDRPAVRVSRHRPVAVGAHAQIECRSLAEQLVCEANAMLPEDGPRLWLVDNLDDGELSFSISYRDRQARVLTSIAGSVAQGHLYGLGARYQTNIELAGPEQVEQLILLLIRGDQSQGGQDVVPAAGTLPL